MPQPTSTLRWPDGVSPRRRGDQANDALDRAMVAELSSRDIRRMTQSELIRVIQSGRTPPLKTRPENLDRPTLERLAHRSSLSCRNRPG